MQPDNPDTKSALTARQTFHAYFNGWQGNFLGSFLASVFVALAERIWGVGWKWLVVLPMALVFFFGVGLAIPDSKKGIYQKLILGVAGVLLLLWIIGFVLHPEQKIKDVAIPSSSENSTTISGNSIKDSPNSINIIGENNGTNIVINGPKPYIYKTFFISTSARSGGKYKTEVLITVVNAPKGLVIKCVSPFNTETIPGQEDSGMLFGEGFYRRFFLTLLTLNPAKQSDFTFSLERPP